MLIDYAEIHLKAGNGGSGALSFRREKFVPKGGPDGGDGGKGGDIYFVVDPSMRTLQDFRFKRHYRAQNGQPGRGSNKTGAGGADLVLPVPPGTLIKAKTDGKILADLVEPGQRFLAVKGGRGGRGNARFATATNRAPRRFEEGAPGEELDVILELKLIADVGLVGLPNAGKSTLLSRISKARPKIADYPFTTLEPHLGIVEAGDYRSFVVADIPGLIEGAGRGRGLGHRFLKHIERTRVLLFLIDGSVPAPEVTLRTLEREVETYNPELLQRPRLVVLTKADLPFSPDTADFRYDLAISAVTGKGLTELIAELWRMIQKTDL